MQSEIDVELLCKNCQHLFSLHTPKCSAVDQEGVTEEICYCEKPEYYNAIISGRHIGWTEIHCNSCGKLLAYIDSASENIYDFTVRCKRCIISNH